MNPAASSTGEAREPRISARSAARPVLVLTSRAAEPCAVETFAGRLAATLGETAGPARLLVLGAREGGLGEIWRAIGEASAVVVNVPLVAWKRLPVRPLLALGAARLRRREAVLVLHEWGALHPLRRLALLPALHLASRIVLLSPQIRAEMAADPLARPALGRTTLAPLPPNIGRPPAPAPSPLAERLRAARREGRLVIGHFGSIYPGKQPRAVLEIAAALKARGARPLVAFIGSFIRGSDRTEAEFRSRAAALGLTDDVVVSGYVASEAELFGLFAEVDAFAYVFAEGLTARRSSVLACVQAGRPVVATAPGRADEFDHHPRYLALVESGALTLAPRDASPEAFADLIEAAVQEGGGGAALDVDAWWRDAAAAMRLGA